MNYMYMTPINFFHAWLAFSTYILIWSILFSRILFILKTDLKLIHLIIRTLSVAMVIGDQILAIISLNACNDFQYLSRLSSGNRNTLNF